MTDGRKSRAELEAELESLRRRLEQAERSNVGLKSFAASGSGLKFEEMFDLEAIQVLQDAFAEAMGVASLMTSPDGTPITRPSNFSRLCGEVVRKTEKGLANCMRSDGIFSRECIDGPSVKVCSSAGLLDGAACIRVDGVHIANWLIGQVRDEASDEKDFLGYADEIGADREIFRKALSEVPTMKRETFVRACEALSHFSSVLSDLAGTNRKLFLDIEARDKVERDFLRQRKLFASGPVVVVCWNAEPNWPVNYVSPNIRQFGYQAADLMDRSLPYLSIIDPRDKERVEDEVRANSLAGIPFYDHDYRIICADGRSRWVYDFTMPVRNGEGKIVAYDGYLLDVTKRKNMEEALKKSEEQFRLVADFTYDWEYWLDRNGQLLYVSPSCERITGYKAKEFMNDPGLMERIIHPADQARGKGVRTANVDDSEHNSIEFRIIDRYGDVRWLGHNCRPVYSQDGKWLGRRGSNRDITERKRAEEKLRVSEKLSKTLLNSTLDLAYLIDSDGVFIAANEIGAGRFHMKGHELVGRNMKDLVEWDAFETCMAQVEEAHCSKQAVRFEDQYRGYYFDSIASPVFDEEGGVKMVSIFARDVTEQKILSRLHEDVERIARHDIKSPLSGIIGLAEMLNRQENLTDKQKGYARSIVEAGKQTMNVLNSSLDFLKMEKGEYVLRPELFNLAGALRKIKRILAVQERAKGLRVDMFLDGESLESSSDYPFVGEERHIENLLTNLTKNAIEAAPDGTVVTVRLDSDENLCQIDIHNQGVVPDALKESFFKKYSTYGKKSGTGLGTYSAMILARAHSGKINVSTSKEEGTHVIVLLPKRAGDAISAY